MVFQNYALYPHIDVAANMGFALKQQGVPKEERSERVARGGAKLLDLEPTSTASPKRSPVASGSASPWAAPSCASPQVFLMDEPLSNLDAKLRVQTRTELVELQPRLAVTTVYVTHDQVEAMTMGTASRCCSDGIPAAGATRREALRPAGQPLRRRVHRLSAMNQLHVSASGPLLIGGADVGIADDFGGERATVGFRPRPSSSAAGPISARIRVIEDLGSEAFVHLVIQHEGEDHRLVAKTAAPFAGALGDNVQIGLRGDVHLFDTSEARRATVTRVTAVLVTGAAGDIGAAIAARLASAGVT